MLDSYEYILNSSVPWKTHEVC